ncbi:MAG: hypothetical protein ACI4Q5_05205, partial [Porcipelethomonas sp.]
MVIKKPEKALAMIKMREPVQNSLFYLGLFSCFMGIWKITDIRSAPLIFTHNTMLLSQISLMMLSLAVVPIAVFIGTQIKNREHKFL